MIDLDVIGDHVMAYQNKKNYTSSEEKKDYRQELID